MDSVPSSLDPITKRSLHELITCILISIVSEAVDDKCEQRRIVLELGTELLEDLERGDFPTSLIRDSGGVLPPGYGFSRR